jgi:3-oxoacyl-[acyl-carrier-protein] synthase-3
MPGKQPQRIDSHYNVGIRTIGRYLPSRLVTNDEIAARLPTNSPWIKQRIGVETRHYSAPDEWSSDLGAHALLDACEQLGVDPRSIDLVICGTATADNILPHTAAAIMFKAGVANGTPGFDVNSGGCPGSIFALDVGAKYVASGEYSRVAVVLADVTSKLFDPEDRTVSVIFGDGAACYLLEPTLRGPSIANAVLHTLPAGYRSAWAERGTRLDASGQRKTSAFGDNFMTMNGREVWNFVAENIPGFALDVLAKEGLTPDDVDFYALHQANINLVNLVMGSLEQPMSKTVTNIDRIGNTAGASVPLVLREATDSGQLKPGDLVFLLAFGGGLNYGATLVRWCGPDDFVPLAGQG